MPPLEKPRAWPELEPSTEPASRAPRLRPGGGGGREYRDAGTARRPATSRELWLAVQLPQLMLEALEGTLPLFASSRGSVLKRGASLKPLVVVDQERGGKVVCACNALAVADGIAIGMALNSALALQPRLAVRDRSPQRERELLEQLAERAVRYTSRVSLEPPDAVLLEVRGSLRLFGGSRLLLARLRAELDAAGLAPRLALAPTPLASLWFARAGEERIVDRREDLAGRLAALPLACTNWPERDLLSLTTMGVRTVGECLRLPRDGLARRFGPELSGMLDRALGRRPDPRSAPSPHERFTARRDLEPEVTETAGLEAVVAPLLAGLCAFLHRRQRGVQALELRLMHREAPPTRLRLRFAELVSHPARITQLLRERLGRIELPEPVRALSIASGTLLAMPLTSHELFAMDRRHAGPGVSQLVERLQARLGADAVHGLCLIPEHRPEFAWQATLPFSEAKKSSVSCAQSIPESKRRRKTATRAVAAAIEHAPVAERPLWLLAEPQALEGVARPRFEGELELEEGPERIESGWWDGRDVARDYYVARNPAGARLWVFRERHPPRRWFLHGVFG
jgi:protein ImuB